MSLVGLVITLGIVFDERQGVDRILSWMRQAPLQQDAGLRQSQGGGVFFSRSRKRSRKSCARKVKRMCRCQAVHERCS